MKVKLLSLVGLLVTPWTAAYQAPLTMGFSRQKYWSGVPLPSPVFLLIRVNYSYHHRDLFSCLLVLWHTDFSVLTYSFISSDLKFNGTLIVSLERLCPLWGTRPTMRWTSEMREQKA